MLADSNSYYLRPSLLQREHSPFSRFMQPSGATPLRATSWRPFGETWSVPWLYELCAMYDVYWSDEGRKQKTKVREKNGSNMVGSLILHGHLAP
jgi:hypothetical protein